MSLLASIHAFESAFRNSGLEPPVVIRLKDKDQGMHFANILAKEVNDAEFKWKPGISFVEVAGIRFVWPMPEQG
jgi:hypothetical protein